MPTCLVQNNRNVSGKEATQNKVATRVKVAYVGAHICQKDVPVDVGQYGVKDAVYF